MIMFVLPVGIILIISKFLLYIIYDVLQKNSRADQDEKNIEL